MRQLVFEVVTLVLEDLNNLEMEEMGL